MESYSGERMFDDPDPVWQGRRSMLDVVSHLNWAAVAVALIVGIFLGKGVL